MLCCCVGWVDAMLDWGGPRSAAFLAPVVAHFRGGLYEADDQRGSAPVPVLQATCRVYLHCTLFACGCRHSHKRAALVLLFARMYVVIRYSGPEPGQPGASRVCTVVAYAAREGHDSAKQVVDAGASARRRVVSRPVHPFSCRAPNP